MASESLAFIGGGHMARALIGGLLGRGWQAAQVHVADPMPEQRASLQQQFPGLHVHADNLAAAAAAGTWILAVKPQQLRDVALALAPLAAQQRPLAISVAAGVRGADLGRWLGPGAAVVRAMPNRPALLQLGVTGLHADASVDAAARERAAAILGAVGGCVWLADEADMDAVTAVSGSGPAYFFLLIELLEAAAVAEGLPPATARQLAVETAYGSARMARDLDIEPATLREQVTSKGGTTAAALAELERADLRAIVARAVHAARTRSAELADQFGETPSG